MVAYTLGTRRFRGIAFLGNYIPRACGIATFTTDLAGAVASHAGSDQPVIVAAMNDLPEGYAYPARVKFELRQNHLLDYSRAADFLNFSHIDVVCLQHEYGIFGGEAGSNVLTFLKNLNKPAVVTCHTVLEEPKKMQREVLAEIASHSEKLVVMSHRAVDLLASSYGIHRDKIVYIPHGIHDAPFIDPSYYKDKFGVEGRRVLLTFGLLRREKGIEYMIDALPAIVAKHPKTTYVVLGTTHPAVIRDEGESYRLSLQRRIRELGIEKHVIFYPRFVELSELLEYLGAADIFVTPYLYLEQITSGALAYAMGTGKAVVSTPYWHAEEILADNRGMLVPPKNSEALAAAVNELLDDEGKLNALRKRAYLHCRSMVWSSVARAYLDVFDEVRSRMPVEIPMASALRSPIAATNLPLPSLDHLLRLSDDTGPATHARHSVPDWRFGYALDDGAAALVACTKHHKILNNPRAGSLAETCLTLLQTLIGGADSQTVAAGLDYSRNKRGIAKEESVAKALWALGYMIGEGPKYLSLTAYDLFHQILPSSAPHSPRAAAYGILGTCNYLNAFPGATAVKRLLQLQAKVLQAFVSRKNWHTEWPASDWPVATQALSVAGNLLDDNGLRELTSGLLKTASEVTANGTRFLAQGANQDEEELPIIAATFIEAFSTEFKETRDTQLLAPTRAAVDWFLGANQLNAPVYNFETRGCHDALSAPGLNGNQGAEATAYCQLAFLSLNEIVALQKSPKQ